jgi:PAS domain S-box-containing protein
LFGPMLREPYRTTMELPEIWNHPSRLLEELLSSMREAFIVADLEGQILFTSPSVERMTGFTSDELKNEALSAIFTSEDLTYLYPNLLHLARANKSFKGEIILMRKNKVRFFAFVTFRPFFDPGHSKSRIFVCIQDIHNEKRIQKVLEITCFEDLVRIANGVAHELRNPLVGIGGFLKRLYEMCDISGDQRKYYDHTISNLKRIENLVKKVEFLSRLPVPKLRKESIRGLIEKATRPYLQQFEDRKIELTINLEEAFFPLASDLLVRAFSILIENALDVLSDGQRILIHGDTENNNCTILVSDTGPGISPDDLPFVFDPFFSTKADGAGIDLAIVKRIMNSHGGSIEVNSKRGEGTTFVLLFPLERRRSIRISHLQD